MNKFLIIGDVHGCYDELQELLNLQAAAGRFIIFLGDIIDRGEAQEQTLRLVQKLVETKQAVCIMGNHEYNAIMVSLGLRQSDGVHQVFLQAFPQGSERYYEALAFLKGLPLFIQYPAFTAIHACYLKSQLELLNPYLDEQHAVRDGSRSDRFFTLSREKAKAPNCTEPHDKALQEALHISLKGTEYKLPAPYFILDKEDKERHEVRTKWWLEHPVPLSKLAFSQYTTLGDAANLEVNPLKLNYRCPEKPVFIGHYWLKGRQEDTVAFEETVLLKDLIYCLDFSCVKGGHLCGMCVDTQGDSITDLTLLSVKHTA